MGSSQNKGFVIPECFYREEWRMDAPFTDQRTESNQIKTTGSPIKPFGDDNFSFQPSFPKDLIGNPAFKHGSPINTLGNDMYLDNCPENLVQEKAS